MRSSCRGVTSNSTARESGTSASERTGRPVSIVPPSSARRARHGVGDGLRPAPGAGPAGDVPRGEEHQAHAVVSGRDSGRNAWAAAPAKSPRASSVEKARPATVAGRMPRSPNAGQRERVAGHPQQRGEHRGREVVPATGGPADVPVPGPAVLAQARHRVVERPVEHPGAAVVERVDEGDLRVDQLEAVALEVGRLEERRHRGQGVDRRAHVVEEARQGELRGAGPAADGVGAFEDEHRAARLRARDGGGQPVGTGSHDHDIGHVVTLGCS